MRSGWMVLVALVGCGDDGHVNEIDGNNGGSVSGHVTSLNGATPAGMALTGKLPAPRPPPGLSAVPENGKWLVSPKTLSMKLTKLSLSGATSSTPPTTVDCMVTFDQTMPGLAQLGDCPFTISAGTYDTVNLSFSTSVTIVVDDAVAGLYSTAAGLQTTPPVTVAAFTYSYDSSTEVGLSPIKLAAPVTVADGDTINLSIVINALQALHFTVNGTAVTSGWTGTSYTTPGRPDIVGTVGALAKIKMYASPALDTAASYCAGGCTSIPPAGITSVSVFYTTTTTAAFVGVQLNGNPATCVTALYPSFCNDAKCYVGRDTNGVIGWAVGADPNFAAYSAVFAMPTATNISDGVDLYCSATSTDPAPSGGSFASGAPAIQTGGNSMGTYTLVAQ